MKEYKLSGWPELGAPYQRICFRRMLSDMSHRYMSLTQLIASSGSSRTEVRGFLVMLSGRGLLMERETEPQTFADSIGEWFRRTVNGNATLP
jgi:hypothetical protein